MTTVRKCITGLALAGFLFGATSAANAETRGISMSPNSLSPQGTATVTSTLNLPDVATPAMFVTFIVPPDYTQGYGTVRVVVLMQTTAACSAVLSVGAVTRRRPGFASQNVNGLLGGVEPVGDSAVATFSGAGIVLAKSYLVRKPQNASFSGVKPGDSFSIRLDRLVDDAADNCASTIFVAGVEVRYETGP